MVKRYIVEDPAGFKKPRYVEEMEWDIENFINKLVKERYNCEFEWGIEALRNAASHCDKWEELKDE